MSKTNAAIGNKSIEGIVKAREVAKTIEKECPRYKISKERAVGVTMNEIALIEYYEQKLTAKKLDDYNIIQSRERLIETCKDQGSKIVDLKHEIDLIINFIDTVNLVNVLDKKEAAYSIHQLLISDGGLKNISRTLKAKLGDLEEMACTLFDIDDDEIVEPLQIEE